MRRSGQHCTKARTRCCRLPTRPRSRTVARPRIGTQTTRAAATALASASPPRSTFLRTLAHWRRLASFAASRRCSVRASRGPISSPSRDTPPSRLTRVRCRFAAAAPTQPTARARAGFSRCRRRRRPPTSRSTRRASPPGRCSLCGRRQAARWRRRAGRRPISSGGWPSLRPPRWQRCPPICAWSTTTRSCARRPSTSPPTRPRTRLCSRRRGRD
mmetsp:Transcript_4216/g.14127  ORF Transcript_4216/g.14127 Transcript_4216/m.14127 type:complete len:215 (+) Transcript_4216:1285-1929(+)